MRRRTLRKTCLVILSLFLCEFVAISALLSANAAPQPPPYPTDDPEKRDDPPEDTRPPTITLTHEVKGDWNWNEKVTSTVRIKVVDQYEWGWESGVDVDTLKVQLLSDTWPEPELRDTNDEGNTIAGVRWFDYTVPAVNETEQHFLRVEVRDNAGHKTKVSRSVYFVDLGPDPVPSEKKVTNPTPKTMLSRTDITSMLDSYELIEDETQRENPDYGGGDQVELRLASDIRKDGHRVYYTILTETDTEDSDDIINWFIYYEQDNTYYCSDSNNAKFWGMGGQLSNALSVGFSWVRKGYVKKWVGEAEILKNYYTYWVDDEHKDDNDDRIDELETAISSGDHEGSDLNRMKEELRERKSRDWEWRWIDSDDDASTLYNHNFGEGYP